MGYTILLLLLPEHVLLFQITTLNCIPRAEIAQSVWQLAVCSTSSTPSLGPTQIPIQWVLELFSGDKAAGALGWPLTSS
jgi:hypothetical protein